MTDAVELGPSRSRLRPILLVPCALLALVCALVPFTSLRALGAAPWLGLAVAAAVFPVLPLVWHALAERQRAAATGFPATGIERFALRAVAVGGLVLVVSFSNLGPGRVGAGLAGLVRRPGAPAASAPAGRGPGVAAPAPTPEGLERFLPADASSVVSLADAAVMRHLLGRAGADTQDKLAALQKCQIIADRARILIAARDRDTRLIVVRAPGVTDPRNLYCLAGFLGSERLRLRFTSDKAPIRFEVDGLLPRTLRFTAIDDQTVMAVEGGWAGDGATRRPGAGPLGAVLARVDRGAALWSASVFPTPGGPWDLALDARLQDQHLRLRGSSIPPGGPPNQAVIDTRVPLAFVNALPAAALDQGLRGLVGILNGAASGPPAPAAPPNPAAVPVAR